MALLDPISHKSHELLRQCEPITDPFGEGRELGVWLSM